jgi:hypothetical protein
MARHLHQQKAEAEILKTKCESINVQKYGVAEEFEKERKRMLREMDRMNDEFNEIEALKNAEIQEIKTQFQLELQTLKRQYHSSEESYELEIRNLHEQMDKR